MFKKLQRVWFNKKTTTNIKPRRDVIYVDKLTYCIQGTYLSICWWQVTEIFSNYIRMGLHLIVQFRIRYDRWLKALKTHLHRVSLDLK